MHGSYIGNPAMEDDLDIVPGGGSRRRASSPIVLAGMFISGLCRPGRLRGRLTIALITSLLLAAAYMARGNTVCEVLNS
jgi:hypothetical protein